MNDKSIKEQVDSDLLNQAALKLLDAKEYQRALELLKLSLESDAENESTQVLLGLTYQSLDKKKEAEVHFREAIEINPHDDEALLSLGLFLSEFERHEEGAKYLTKYLEEGNWGDIGNLGVLVDVLSGLDRQESAIDIARNAWEKTIEPEIGRLLVHLLKDANRSDEVVSVLKHVASITREPDDYSELAEIVWSEKKYKDFIRYLETAFELEEYPLFAEPGFSYEEYESAGGDWPILRYPDTEKLASYMSDIAYAYSLLENWEEALEAIEVLFHYSFGHPANYYRQSEAFLKLNRFEEAIESANKGIACLSDDDTTWASFLYNNKAEGLVGLGENQKALDILEEGREKYPSGFLFVVSANALIKQGSMQDAIRLHEDEISKGAGNSEILSEETPYFLYNYITLLSIQDIDSVPKDILDTILQACRQDELEKLISFLLRDKSIPLIVTQSLLDSFLEKYPTSVYLLTSLAWLNILDEEYENASQLLKNASKILMDFDEEMIETFYGQINNNLGYIALVQNTMDQADTCFNRILATEPEQYPFRDPPRSMLGIAFFRHGKIHPDHMPVLSRKIDPISACYANLVTLGLAQADYDKAMEFTTKILGRSFVPYLGYEVLGFVSLAKGDRKAALVSWETALTKIDDEEQKLAIQKLIDAEGLE